MCLKSHSSIKHYEYKINRTHTNISDKVDLMCMMVFSLPFGRQKWIKDIFFSSRDDLDAYSFEMEHLAMKMLDLMAKALKMEGCEMRELFEEGMLATRMNYYPPCPQPELVIGLTNHSDASGITILLQVNEMEGLQIRKDGRWIPVKPLPNAFVVNIGDVLEVKTLIFLLHTLHQPLKTDRFWCRI